MYFLSGSGKLNAGDWIAAIVVKPNDGYGIPSETC
jgi:hypothetical protein